MRRGYLDDPETGDFPGERVFDGRAQIKYVLEGPTDDAHALVVSFSAAHAPDEPPRYNGQRILRDFDCPRLYLLDDQGPREPLPRPCWYLGTDRVFDVADSVLEVLERIAGELHLPRRRVVTCGASKGGWAALYFGARFGAGHAIAGEPGTMLGQHLCQDENASIAAHIAGDASEESCEFLDGILFEAFRGAGDPPQVHLFSGRTAYYDRHVLPLVAFLEQEDTPCELELGDHTEHVPDLGLNYPVYLRRRLEQLLASDGRPAGRRPDLAAPRP